MRVYTEGIMEVVDERKPRKETGGDVGLDIL